MDRKFYENMFDFGYKLTKENFGDFDYEGVDDVEYIFHMYYNDKRIQVRFFKGYGVDVVIGDADTTFTPFNDPGKTTCISFTPFNDVDELISFLKKIS